MASGAVQFQNFVGKEVNGFEIIKLIGTISFFSYSPNRSREIFLCLQSL